MATKNDSLEVRMKEYEGVSKNYLTRKIPVIIRLDGKAFRTFTKNLEKPFDKALVKTMQRTMKYLCENIQGCVFGYTQSDEITLVLVDYKNITTDSWYNYNVQKVVSVSASMCTLAFNRYWEEELRDICGDLSYMELDEDEESQEHAELEKRMKVLWRKQYMATFDARAFNIPKEEVCNCLIWRQQDAIRNSIESVGNFYFDTKSLYKKSCPEVLDMLLNEKHVDWNNYPVSCKRGTSCYKHLAQKEVTDKSSGKTETVFHRVWFIDEQTPVFKDDKSYVGTHL